MHVPLRCSDRQSAQGLCDAGTGFERSDAQVIASLLVSAVMLGVKGHITQCHHPHDRKQELKMLVAQLTLPRSQGSNIPAELMQRVRRATEHGPADMSVVCVLRSAP